jgi:hypothetical protein
MDRSSCLKSSALLAPALCALTLVSVGCLDRALAPLNPCLVSGVTESVNVTNIDKVDLLFLVDDSSSMEDKQTNLRQHVPQLVQTLVTGMRMPNDPNAFPPVTDLHIAVVDSDMGLPGVTGIPGCSGYGDDGLFQHTPHASPENPTCDASYPTFLSYLVDSPTGPSADKISRDFGCIANVGAMGCGDEQQLEAVLKSLWPSTDQRVVFLGDANSPERLGHGDRENAGFLRNDPSKGLSLLAIVVLSDEDDGSTGDMELYLPPNQLPANTWVDPSTHDDLNLRPLIGTNRDHLFSTSRYIDSFKALRSGNENLVVFAAITGVPLDLVDDKATASVDFTDQTQRDAFYDGILADQRMQNVPDNTPSPGKMVVPACLTSFGHGYPGRRYIEVAKGIGENATVYSICEPDYTPAINNIINVIANQLRTVCLPRALVRAVDGKVSCNVIWQLPTAANRSSNDVPIQCSDAPQYLTAPDPTQAQTAPGGGALCTVNQLAVVEGKVADGDGWYYDNFSADIQKTCKANTPQRIAFSTAAHPPTGVTVKLQCLNETQQVPNRDPSAVPSVGGQVAAIGSSCEVAPTGDAGTSVDPDSLCIVHHSDGSLDTSLFCYLPTNTCVKACNSGNDCPAAWICDNRSQTIMSTTDPAKRPAGSAICVNPTCGAP